MINVIFLYHDTNYFILKLYLYGKIDVMQIYWFIDVYSLNLVWIYLLNSGNVSLKNSEMYISSGKVSVDFVISTLMTEIFKKNIVYLAFMTNLFMSVTLNSFWLHTHSY